MCPMMYMGTGTGSGATDAVMPEGEIVFMLLSMQNTLRFDFSCLYFFGGYPSRTPTGRGEIN